MSASAFLKLSALCAAESTLFDLSEHLLGNVSTPAEPKPLAADGDADSESDDVYDPDVDSDSEQVRTKPGSKRGLHLRKAARPAALSSKQPQLVDLRKSKSTLRPAGSKAAAVKLVGASLSKPAPRPIGRPRKHRPAPAAPALDPAPALTPAPAVQPVQPTPPAPARPIVGGSVGFAPRQLPRPFANVPMAMIFIDNPRAYTSQLVELVRSNIFYVEIGFCTHAEAVLNINNGLPRDVRPITVPDLVNMRRGYMGSMLTNRTRTSHGNTPIFVNNPNTRMDYLEVHDRIERHIKGVVQKLRAYGKSPRWFAIENPDDPIAAIPSETLIKWMAVYK